MVHNCNLVIWGSSWGWGLRFRIMIMFHIIMITVIVGGTFARGPEAREPDIWGSSWGWLFRAATAHRLRARCPDTRPFEEGASPMKSEPPTPTRAPDDQFRKV